MCVCVCVAVLLCICVCVGVCGCVVLCVCVWCCAAVVLCVCVCVVLWCCVCVYGGEGGGAIAEDEDTRAEADIDPNSNYLKFQRSGIEHFYWLKIYS